MSYKTDKEKGRLAEISLCRALVEMGAGVMWRPHTTDAGEHIDVISFRPHYVALSREEYERMAEAGQLDQDEAYGNIGIRFIDAKWAAGAPYIWKVRAGGGDFFVEWKSGNEELCTPLSDENALTTHLALMRMTDGKQQGRHSFYLLNVADVRAFYLKYNDGSGKYIKSVPGDYPHAVLIDCKKFAEEYGFAYFWYDEELMSWCEEPFGRWGCAEGLAIAKGEGLLWAQRVLEHQKQQLSEGVLPINEMLMEEAETAARWYADEPNPMKAMQKAIADHVPKYDERYKFKVPEKKHA